MDLYYFRTMFLLNAVHIYKLHTVEVVGDFQVFQVFGDVERAQREAARGRVAQHAVGGVVEVEPPEERRRDAQGSREHRLYQRAVRD